MAIAKRNEGAKVNSNINVTPMVDVMLVLLIIFMVVTPMLQKGVSVDMAKVNNPEQMPDADKEDALIVAVMRDGNVFFGNDKIARRSVDRQSERSAGEPSRTSASTSAPTRARSSGAWSRSWTTSARPAWTNWAC